MSMEKDANGNRFYWSDDALVSSIRAYSGCAFSCSAFSAATICNSAIMSFIRCERPASRDLGIIFSSEQPLHLGVYCHALPNYYFNF